MLTWSVSETPACLHAALRRLADFHALQELSDSASEQPTLTFRQWQEQGVCCQQSNQGFKISFDTVRHALRGVGNALSGLLTTVPEYIPFSSFGIMQDCSRNAVLLPEEFERWLCRLSLLGYNMAMLYTEDTYQLSGEPLFGYQRGALSAEDIRHIDAYASELGIEIIACFQTLGHMEQVLKWKAYNAVKDDGSVLLCESEQTYELIEKMLVSWKESLTTNRVHIGMDEAWGLGRGSYLKQHGYVDGFELFNRHLLRVKSLCDKHGLQPMIWSDMYFSLGSVSNNYYDPASRVPAAAIASIPKGVPLVYWDYYHDNPDFYADFIRRHKELGVGDPVMASGITSWLCPWYDKNHVNKNVPACVAASREAGLQEIFFTMWGDDGDYCHRDSVWNGLALAAEHAIHGHAVEDVLQQRVLGVCGLDYAAQARAADMNHVEGMEAVSLIWDDPLLALYAKRHEVARPGVCQRAEQFYRAVLSDLNEHTDHGIQHACTVLRLCAEKCGWTWRLLSCYQQHDIVGLQELRDKYIPACREAVRAYADSMRAYWIERHTPFGLEVLQIRLGGQIERWNECERRLDAYIAGTVTNIPELHHIQGISADESEQPRKFKDLGVATSCF